MNLAMLLSLVRSILLSLGGYFVGKGYVDNETMQSVVAAIITIATATWGALEKRGNNASTPGS